MKRKSTYLEHAALSARCWYHAVPKHLSLTSLLNRLSTHQHAHAQKTPCTKRSKMLSLFVPIHIRPSRARFQGLHHRLFNKLKNSSLVFALFRIAPSMQLVVVVAPAFCTPRITMHRCELSITTATPWGFKTSERASATCFVSRSWTCRRRENISAMRASLLRPITRREGM